MSAPLRRTPSAAFWHGRSVLVTGHTGFKGAWLSLWLSELGAKVHGLALQPEEPSLFTAAGLASCLASDARCDVRDAAALGEAVARARPEIVLHLAAQSLVRRSHAQPLETLATNVMGTAHVLQASLAAGDVAGVVVVTSDKCYDNREWVHPYRETDPLGGLDPYSASKACAEIVTASWRHSFAQAPGAPRVASARAGNVIGAWDWGADRLVPDCVRAFSEGRPVGLRNPSSIRPWQHVLEPLSGYLLLAENLCSPAGAHAAIAWNFGPDFGGDASVGEVADALARLWGAGATVVRDPAAGAAAVHEAGILRLDSTAAHVKLGWAPRWGLEHALERTLQGYRHPAGPGLRDLLATQIAEHSGSA